MLFNSLLPLFRRLDVVGHGLWVSEDDVAADWRRPSLPARPASCCDAGGSEPGLCGLPGHAELPISCGYLPLLEQYSLTLSINYFFHNLVLASTRSIPI